MRIGSRIALTACSVALAVGVALAVTVTWLVREHFREELTKRGAFIASTVARRATPDLLAGDGLALQLGLNELRESDPDLAYAFLLDDAGRVVAHTFDGGFPRGLAAANPHGAGEGVRRRDLGTENGLVADFALPIAEGRLGTARIGLSHRPLERGVRELLLLIAAVTGGVLLVGFLAAIVLARAVARPLAEMARAAARVGAGHLAERVPEHRGGELGRLAESFNAMVSGLERAAEQQRGAREATAEQLRLQSLVASVGIALAGSAPLREMLGHCTDALAEDLGAALARIWVLDPESGTLVLRASSGLSTRLDGEYASIPVGRLEVGRIAAEGKPRFTNDAAGDPLIRDREWVLREGIVAFAGHPLLAGGKTVGVMAAFFREALPEASHRMFASVADLVATGIERRLAEEALVRSRELTRRVIDSVDEGFVVLDRDLRILDANAAYCAAAGLTREAIAGRRCHEVTHGTARPCFESGEPCAVERVFASGEVSESQHVHRGDDGSVIHVLTRAFPLGRDERGVATVIETVTNVSERHLLEEQRLKTQKLEAVGTLAGGIAHDFNNLLQGVFGYISLAKLRLAGNAAAADMLERAEQALATATALTNQLLTFSKGGQPVKGPVDLGTLVGNVVRFCTSGSPCSARVAIAEGLAPVEADEGQLGQVLQNLVINALEAMPGGGTLSVSTGRGEGEVPAPLAPGSYTVITVEDSGCGIPPEEIGRIFDPYFTTKERGSGLGLATAYSIVRNHGGTIEVRSAPGSGSTFRVWLPARRGREGEEAEAAAAAAHGPAAARARILLMDDEEIVRRVGESMLAELGHDVEVAEHGEDALEKFRRAREAGRAFDAVILDLTIRGGMGGLETLGRLREIDPAVRAIVSSGYSDDAATARHLACGFQTSLGKPYRLDALRAALATVLG